MRVWLDGVLVDGAQARISPFDRGFLFGDGVYEVVRFFDHVGVGLDLHTRRLRESLRLAGIDGIDAKILPEACDALLADLGTGDATVYLQVTRGAAAERAHLPSPGLRPTVFAYATPTPALATLAEPSVLRARIMEDMRWRACQIKTISLMGNILHLLEASGEGCEEALLHRGGVLGEGTGSNLYAVIGGQLVTPPTDGPVPILHGVMRHLVLEWAVRDRISHAVRPISVTEIRGAEEVFITGSRRILGAVTHLDGAPVGSGSTGPIARAALAGLRESIAGQVSRVREAATA